MKKRSSLHTFIHRTLIYRLAVVTLVLSFIFAVAVLFMERDRVSEEVIDIVVDNVTFFAGQYDHLLSETETIDPEKIKQAIFEFKEGRTLNKLGTFIYLSIFDRGNRKITEVYSENKRVEDLIKHQGDVLLDYSHVPDRGYHLVFIGGMPCLKISIPFVNKNDKLIGRIHTIFALSGEVISSSRERGFRAMIMAVLTILATTVTLYPIILRLTRRIINYSDELLKTNLGALETLGSAIAMRDSDTNAHNYRVSIYAARLGEKIGLPDKTMRALIKGSFLHDIGKIGIPDNILLKPGRLNETEFEKMKTHVESGQEIVSHSSWLKDAVEVILGHHEKVAGTGYPLGLAGEDIPITARIFAIADVFDALTSKRPYKDAWSYEEAIDIMDEGKGAHFDPFLIEQFKEIARPLYDNYGGKEDVSRRELFEIINRYFYEKRATLEY